MLIKTEEYPGKNFKQQWAVWETRWTTRQRVRRSTQVSLRWRRTDSSTSAWATSCRTSTRCPSHSTRVSASDTMMRSHGISSSRKRNPLRSAQRLSMQRLWSRLAFISNDKHEQEHEHDELLGEYKFIIKYIDGR